MAAAKKCDRCGNFYERNKAVSMYGEHISSICLCSDVNRLKSYDFCDGCVQQFMDFMKCETEIEVDQTKTLDEQGLASCRTCKFYNGHLGVCKRSMRVKVVVPADNTCCTNYERSK